MLREGHTNLSLSFLSLRKMRLVIVIIKHIGICAHSVQLPIPIHRDHYFRTMLITCRKATSNLILL